MNNMYIICMNAKAYLQELPEDRRKEAEKIRSSILKHLPEGYEEALEWGMICYQVPLSRFPDTYNKKPLMYAALAAGKNKFSLYLTDVYQDKAKKEALIEAFKNTGKKPDMGKSCIRFKKADEIPIEMIEKLIGGTPVDKFIENYKRIRNNK